MRQAEFFRDRPPRRIEIDANDLVGAGDARALDDVEPDAAEPEYRDIGARPHFRGVDDGADAGGDAAADVANFIERRVLAHFGERDFRQHGEIGEGRAAHVVEHRVAVAPEARRAVRHHALALRGADGGAQVRAARETGFALPAFRRVKRDDVIAGLQRGDAGADLAHDAGAFVAEDGREDAFRVGARQRVGVGVADAGRHDLDQHLAGLRALDVDDLDGERLARLPGNGCADLHGYFAPEDSNPLFRSSPRKRGPSTKANCAWFVTLDSRLRGNERKKVTAARPLLSISVRRRRSRAPGAMNFHNARKTSCTPWPEAEDSTSGVFLHAFLSFAVCALIASGVSASAFDSATISGLSVSPWP